MKHRFLLIFLFTFLNLPSKAYSLLTHEAIIDVSWEKSIRPLLLQKYPDSTPGDLLEAHAYAYGGAIMPDIGYSPFGSKLYTDFVHNVRTGDYVEALLDESETLNEYAFSLGALAHYMADNYGHMLGTNVAVPLVYPKVKAEFGDVVTYADHNRSHSRMELGFDVLQTARGNYATQDYHNFIGFKVARPVIEKAFFRTYGIDVNEVFGSMSVAISTFRWSIKSFLPILVRTAWASKKSELKKATPGLTARKFSYRMKNRTYYHEFGREHQKAGFFPTIVSFLLPVLPKIGPLAKLRFKTPTPEAERLFVKSFDTTLDYYRQSFTSLRAGRDLDLPNLTLDTGHKTALGQYSIADDNYAEFLLMQYEKNFVNLSPEIRKNLLSFYSSGKAPAKEKNSKKWKEVSEAISALKLASGTDISAK